MSLQQCKRYDTSNVKYGIVDIKTGNSVNLIVEPIGVVAFLHNRDKFID
jgi:hypothetical protein